MAEYFPSVKKVKYEGPDSKNPFAFKHYDPQEKVLGKKWTTEMAEGMCDFLRRSIRTLKDLNDYCYYVAGTVGIYLTNLLRLKGNNITDKAFQRLEENAVSFGLFLQKLNIIRDFVEDNTVKNR